MDKVKYGIFCVFLRWGRKEAAFYHLLMSHEVLCAVSGSDVINEQVNPVADDEGESSDDNIEVVHSYRQTYHSPTTRTTHLPSRYDDLTSLPKQPYYHSCYECSIYKNTLL